MEETAYKVQLENFYGPFDLLLYLVKEEELNIYDIPIARIAEQYVSYLEAMKQLDINLAGDFLVVAATLMEIKAKTLLPRPEEEMEEQDPRFELVRKLIEYKKFKDISKFLADLIEKQKRTFPRPHLKIPLPSECQPEILIELDLWGLVKNFARLSKEIVLEVPSLSIIYDDVPLEEFIKNILERLSVRPEITLSELVSPRPDRLNVLKNFLAALELAKEKKVNLHQEKDFGEITLKLQSEDTEEKKNTNPAKAGRME